MAAWQQYRQQGFQMLSAAVPADTLAGLLAGLNGALRGSAGERPRYGERNLIARVDAVRRLALSDPLLRIARQVLGAAARPVRSLYFDKLPGANWNVAWHQDTSIAVRQRVALDGFGPWSVKQGVDHVEPPLDFLSAMLTLRLHLDPAGADNGALRVVPGSHAGGRLDSAALLARVNQGPVQVCEAMPGDLLLMNPLLLHSSRKASRPLHRRVVHIEYSARALPAPLQWFDRAVPAQ